MRLATEGEATNLVAGPTVDGMVEQRVRVLIADNHPDVLHATSDLVSDFPGTEVVSLAKNVDETLRQVAELRPDLVLVDAWLSGGGAENAALRIRTIAPQTAVVVVTSVAEDELARKVLLMGVLGCFEKQHLGASLPGILASVRHL